MARITMRKNQETKLSEIFTLYLASAAARGVKDKTLRTYEQHFKAISKRLDVDSKPIDTPPRCKMILQRGGFIFMPKDRAVLLAENSPSSASVFFIFPGFSQLFALFSSKGHPLILHQKSIRATITISIRIRCSGNSVFPAGQLPVFRATPERGRQRTSDGFGR